MCVCVCVVCVYVYICTNTVFRMGVHNFCRIFQIVVSGRSEYLSQWGNENWKFCWESILEAFLEAKKSIL